MRAVETEPSATKASAVCGKCHENQLDNCLVSKDNKEVKDLDNKGKRHAPKLKAYPTFAQIIEPNNLKLAIKEVRRNANRIKNTKTKEKQKDFCDKVEIESFQNLLNPKGKHEGHYFPDIVTCCEIPKADGKTRKVFSPSYKDRIIGKAIAQALQPAYEAIAADCSYAYRPGRSSSNMLRDILKITRGNGNLYVVKVDISGFFDNISHSRLMQHIRQLHPDSGITHLIKTWINNTTIKNYKTREERTMHTGIAQGGTLSPFLSNVAMLEIDQLLKEGNGKAFRYSDDILCIVENEEAAKELLKVLKYNLKRENLQIKEEKTIIQRFAEINFMGLHGTDKGTFQIPDKKMEKIFGKINPKSAVKDINKTVKTLMQIMQYYWNIDPELVKDNRLVNALDERLGEYRKEICGRDIMEEIINQLSQKSVRTI